MKIYTIPEDEDPFEVLRKDHEAADASVQPWQEAIGVGEHFRRSPIDGIPIYGVVLPEEEPRPPELRHYRFSKCYSIVCPRGEMGDIHVSTIEKILSEEQFLKAAATGWLSHE